MLKFKTLIDTYQTVVQQLILLRVEYYITNNDNYRKKIFESHLQTNF